MMWIRITLAAMLAIAVSAAPQDATLGRIIGVVVDSEARPVQGALVTTQCAKLPPVSTDFEGHFVLEPIAITDRPCAIHTERDGFLNGESYGWTSEEVKVQLVREAMIKGNVSDETGMLMRSAAVTLLKRHIQVGHLEITAVDIAHTDEQGRFRFSQLQAGLYRVCGAPYPSPAQQSKDVVYHVVCDPPSEVLDSAPWIALRAGDARDTSLRASPENGGRISGKVTNPEPGMSFLIRRDRFQLGTENFPIGANGDAKTGEFEFRELPPAKYYLDMQSADRKRQAVKLVEVGSGSLEGVELTLQPTPVLLGDVRTDDGSPVPKLTAMFGLANPKGWSGGDGRMDASGRFSIEIRTPGTYRLESFVDQPWYVKSATQNGKDVLSTGVVAQTQNPGPLEVIISRVSRSVEVGIRPDAHGNAPPVAVTALRRTPLGLESARYDTAGPPFRLNNLAPGHYLLFAWPFPQIIGDVEYLNDDYIKSKELFGKEIEITAGSTLQVELAVAKLN